jgi:hypothetical protein
MANAFLSRLVYLLRWFNSGRQIGESAARAREYHFDVYSSVCAAIRSELVAAEETGEISVRPEFSAVMDQLVVPGLGQLMLVNLNWDTVVDLVVQSHLSRTHIGNQNSLHVHGCASQGDALYLPSELTQEPYRSVDEDAAIGTLHGQIMWSLEKAERVVLYGLSLDPLDAELAQILASGWDNPSLKEIHIVNPDHELVVGRVRLLLNPERSVEVVCHDPSVV